MIGNLFFIAIIMSVHADDKIADFESACAKLKKASVCQCLTSNVKRRLASKELSDDQIPVAVQALKGEVPQGEINSTYYDNLADFLAGLEPHCQKNSSYSVDGP